MQYYKGKLFYELTNAIHNHMLGFEFMRKNNLKIARVEGDLLYFLLTQGSKRVNLKDVANHIDVSYSRITHLMDKLVRKNYARRMNCDIDKRVIYAEITPEGIEVAMKYKENNIKMFIDFLKKLPEDDIEPIYQALNFWCGFLQKTNDMLKDEISE